MKDKMIRNFGARWYEDKMLLSAYVAYIKGVANAK